MSLKPETNTTFSEFEKLPLFQGPSLSYTIPTPLSELGSGKRYNTGKLRFDLVNPYAHEGMVSVLTKGATKYEDHNWERGMAWNNVIASLKRHLNAIEKGEDYDEETGELHADHLQCNAHFLSAYYRIYPQGDNRWERVKPRPRIALDIDDVLAKFAEKWCNVYSLNTPTSWYFDEHIAERFKQMEEDKTLETFYMNLEPLTVPSDIPFEPHCYVTSRPVSSEVTTAWLKLHGFPLRPVITVPLNTSKVEALKNQGVDIMVDDKYENFEELNRNGICCFLFDAPHNQRYNVGYKRIKSLKELKF